MARDISGANGATNYFLNTSPDVRLRNDDSLRYSNKKSRQRIQENRKSLRRRLV